MSYDYTACKRSLECLFGLGALGKIKSQYRFASSGACLWRGNWALKLFAVTGIHLYGAALKKGIPASGKCTRSAMVKHQSAAR
ncbi:hypothetical protein TNCV_3707611 [Trichonephila clavipes]|nr:hypothetical protein TNCV_3707611 [Trichonephila clavipes]